jgi:hypothetical protein
MHFLQIRSVTFIKRCSSKFDQIGSSAVGHVGLYHQSIKKRIGATQKAPKSGYS